MYTCMSDPKIYQTWLFLMDHWSPYARVLGSGPRGPRFDLQRGHRSLWPWASHKSTYPGVMVRNWSTHYALKKQQQKTLIIPTHENVKHGSSVVSAMASGARGPGSIPTGGGKFGGPNTLLFMSFAGMT